MNLQSIPKFIVAVFLFGSQFAHANGMMELSVGMHRIQAEVAYTDMGRQKGLMFRNEMPEYQGMLFVFPVRTEHCMWMKNTYLPLAVAFLDEAGKIINIEEMQPRAEKNHCAKQPARFALEMNSGWFKRRGIEAGMQIRGVDKAPVPQ